MNSPRTPVYSPSLPLTMAKLKAQLVVATAAAAVGGEPVEPNEPAPVDETTNDLVVDAAPPQAQDPQTNE